MKRYIILILSLVLALGCCNAQRKNNNVAAPPAKQQAAPKKSVPKKNAPSAKKPAPKKNAPSANKPQANQPQMPKQLQPWESVSGTIAGHEYVDLGLPSGLKWATCNVGASRPEDYGSYFAWGETSTKSKYNSDNCATYDKTTSWLRSNGYIDYSGNLTRSHDAARANWGSTWRMPTKAEIEELIENTTTTWTTYNGVYGRLVTSKRNGKSIFLPAAGFRVVTSLDGEGSNGGYWSSTPLESNTDRAYDLNFISGIFYRGWYYRNYGRSVRPVADGKTSVREKPLSPSQPKTAQPKPTAPPQTANTIAGHEYVDLGLPSGLKWATCNVGASSPEDYGSYFSWGETSTKSEYNSDNCATYNKRTSWLRSNGYIDSRGNLTPSHDAARANWGSTWRMPTEAEIDELIENTTTTWTTRNGVKGRLITSKRNGKSIFLPAAGYRYGTSLYYEGSYGYYWSSTPFGSGTYGARRLDFDSDHFDRDWNGRFGGRSVRPVSE